MDFLVERVSLNGNTLGAENDSSYVLDGKLLGGVRTSHMVNLFLSNGSINIICSEVLSDLSGLDAEHHPVSFYVRNIVE